MPEAKGSMVFHRSLTDLSNEIADVIEHLVIPQLVMACWDRGGRPAYHYVCLGRV